MHARGSNLLEAARLYLARGYAPIPVPAREKKPCLKGWTDLRLSEADLPQHFNCIGNIGLLLGEPSGWLVDVDLDCPEAIELAPHFLPPTLATTGRPSAPNSHWWYTSPGAVTKKHYFPGTRQMIAEIRSTGTQTVVGPSVHPSGEDYEWLMGDPASVSQEVLERAVAALVAAVVQRRAGPVPPLPHDTPQSRADPPPRDQAMLRRATAYLDAMPPAISGQGGHSTTYSAATAMVHGFGLDPDAALHLLMERYNPRCEPPWTEKELRHKVNEAATKPHERPFGWLRDSLKSVGRDDVDLSAILAPRPPVVASPPEPMSGKPPDPGPFPEHLLHVPGFIGEVIAFNVQTSQRPQPVLALAAAISLQATLAARKVRDERGNRTNLYCVGLAPSGAGKDHARKVNKNILFQSGLSTHEGSEDLASDAGLVTAVERQPAVLFQIDEFGRFLRTIGDPKRAPHLFNVLTALMKLYSSADTVFRGKAYAEAKRNKVIDQPCVNVYATTVPEHFFESLTADSLNDGFIARLLVFEAEATPPRQRSIARDVPEHLLEAACWWGEFQPGGNLAREHPVPAVIPCTAEATAIFDELAERVDVELAQSNVEGRSLWARAEEKACRLALVYACSADREQPVIDENAARWACDLSVHMTRRMLFVAGQWVADGQFDARQKRVLRIIGSSGGRISKRDFSRRTQWLTQRERQEVLENLLETEQVEQITEETATKPRVIYALR